jgi:maleate isomerase
MAPGRVITCVARVSVDEGGAGVGANSTTPALRALSTSPLLEQAAELLGRGSLDAVVYASTSSAFAIGFDAEAAVVSRLSPRVRLPVLATCASTVLALRTLGVERVALVHPPWFDAELNDLGAAYFESTGFDVVSSGSAALSQDPRRIDAAAVYEWTSRNVSGAAEAVFIGGNGCRAAGAIGALEVELGRPVLTANQVLLWHLLAETGATCEVGGYGRLFMHEPRPTPQQRRAATAPRSHSDRFRPAAEGADCRGRVAPGPSRASGRRGPRLHASPSGCR